MRVNFSPSLRVLSFARSLGHEPLFFFCFVFLFDARSCHFYSRLSLFLTIQRAECAAALDVIASPRLRDRISERFDECETRRWNCVSNQGVTRWYVGCENLIVTCTIRQWRYRVAGMHWSVLSERARFLVRNGAHLLYVTRTYVSVAKDFAGTYTRDKYQNVVICARGEETEKKPINSTSLALFPPDVSP